MNTLGIQTQESYTTTTSDSNFHLYCLHIGHHFAGEYKKEHCRGILKGTIEEDYKRGILKETIKRGYLWELLKGNFEGG